MRFAPARSGCGVASRRPGHHGVRILRGSNGATTSDVGSVGITLATAIDRVCERIAHTKRYWSQTWLAWEANLEYASAARGLRHRPGYRSLVHPRLRKHRLDSRKYAESLARAMIITSSIASIEAQSASEGARGNDRLRLRFRLPWQRAGTASNGQNCDRDLASFPPACWTQRKLSCPSSY